MTYLIKEHRKDTDRIWYVVARSGWRRTPNGFARDGSPKGGPEWSTNRNHALVFSSHRAAARIANTCPGSVVALAQLK